MSEWIKMVFKTELIVSLYDSQASCWQML